MKYNVKAEIHCHSNAKFILLPYAPLIFDSVQSVEEIIERAIAIGVKILAITDHNSLNGYRKAKQVIEKNKLDIMLISGMEISSREGHILAYNVNKHVRRWMSAEKTLKAIHEQGGIAVAAHPYYMTASLGDRVYKYKFDAVEGYNSLATKKANIRAVEAAKRMGLPCTAGSDAHQLENLGNAVVYFPEDTKTVEDVIRYIKQGEFRTECVHTKVISMIKAHAKANVAKIGSLFIPALRRTHFEY